MKKRFFALILMMLFVTLSLSACQKRNLAPDVPVVVQPDTPVQEPQSPSQPVSKPEPESKPDSPAFVSALTGLSVTEDVYRARPISIMINNNKKALPHYGISQASLYFEILAEGEINRIMAVFDDYKNVPKLGSVRSARDYFMDYSQALNSVFIHFGGSPQAYITIKTKKIPDLDGIPGDVYGTMFYTDETARKNNGLEHSRFTTGDGIVKGFTLKNYETENKGETYFSFYDTPTAAGTMPATYVDAPFSSYITPIFQYNAADMLYYRSQFGEKHIDAGNHEQLTVSNVILLYTEHKILDKEGRRSVKTTGSGEGYYISNGTACKIAWSKDSFNDFLQFTKDGQPLSINRGKTWICILPETKFQNTIIK